ncbi:hypothetical protein P8452_62680 [Trifolium repens]|nr:hypothetical protein P8452_62680 [Trifolium repens]
MRFRPNGMIDPGDQRHMWMNILRSRENRLKRRGIYSRSQILQICIKAKHDHGLFNSRIFILSITSKCKGSALFPV